jgi:misacylated tRNA(Ala) deacylase
MTEAVFREDAYLKEIEARVVAVDAEGAVIPDRSVFYPAGGGQPGDSGRIAWDGGTAGIVDARKGADGTIRLIPAAGAVLPAPGTPIRQTIDWERRHRHMRIHTALHLLSVVIPYPVTGGQIAADRGRLDFDLPEPPTDPLSIEATLNALVARDFPVTDAWITDEELLANPSLVKTMSVRPPMGAGRVRLVRIGTEAERIDLQPCGGTHVARTGEIGRLTLGKIENKGRQNRRVTVHLAG